MKTFLTSNRCWSLAIAVCALFSVNAAAQQKAPPASPAAEDSITFGGKMISVKYGSPGVKGRDIFGKTGQLSKDATYPVWRGGANPATALHTDADLEIGGLTVPKGDYTLFVLVADPDNWQFIINKQTGQWGTVYTPGMDLGRVKMKMSKPAAPVERLYYKFGLDGKNKAILTLAWDNHAGTVNITVK